jgi:hypothetical protein
MAIAITVSAGVMAVMAVLRQHADARVTVMALPLMPLTLGVAQMFAVPMRMLVMKLAMAAVVTVMLSCLTLLFTLGMAIIAVIALLVTIVAAFTAVFVGLHL